MKTNNLTPEMLKDIENISHFLQIWLEKKLLDELNHKIFSRYYYNYKKCWNDYIKYHYTNQTRELMQVLAKIDHPNVLEVGCGCGTESLWMAYHGANVIALDIKTDRLAVAEKRQAIMEECLEKKINCSFQAKSVFDLCSNQQFDVIWMEQALHHIEPRSEALDKLSDLLKPTGFIVISETNALNPLIQIQLLKTRGLKTIVEYKDSNGIKHMYGNERVLTLKQLSSELRKRNIIKQAGRYFRVFPNRPWSIYFMELEKNIPNWFVPIFTHYNYVGKKI
jgi:2-polyprenyl-3-methyl-5-hydroxy-6-metoxy-1,4-benzoquinol methylase